MFLLFRFWHHHYNTPNINFEYRFTVLDANADDMHQKYCNYMAAASPLLLIVQSVMIYCGPLE